MQRGRILIGVGVAVAWLVSCASSPPAPIHHYRLEAGTPAALAAPIFEGTLQIERTRTDAFTSQRSLVYRRVDAPGEASTLHHYARHRWVDPPSRMIQLEIERYLRAAGVAETVVSSELRVRPAYVLRSRLLRLEQTRDPAGVVLSLDVVITAGDDRLVLQESYLIETPLESDSIPASVAAYDAALTRILTRLVEQAAQPR